MAKIRWHFIFLVFTGLALIAATAGAQEDAASQAKPQELEEIVVTSQSIIEGNTVDRYSGQKTIVTQDQISDLNAMDLTSALRRVPGVIISRHNPVGSFGGGEGGSIFIRGHGISRPGAEIQMLIDGIPKFVSVWTHPLMDVLNVDIMDTIEVYKGAQPVLFGNMAFGAVDITPITKKSQGFETRIQSAFGSYDTLVGSIKHGGKIDRFDYYLVGGYKSSDGHRDNAGGELQDYYGHLGYDISYHWDVGLTFIHTDNWADDPGVSDGSIPSDGRFKTKDYFAVATVSNTYDMGKGYVKFYSDTGDIDWVNQEEISGQNTLTDYQNYGIRIRETLSLWENGEVLMGIDFDNISGEVDCLIPGGTDLHFPEETFRITSPYFALSHEFGSRDAFYMIPSAGMRYFNHNKFDNEIGPQAGVTLGYQNTEVHGFYSRGINYPGLYAKVQEDLFMPGPNQWDGLATEIVDHFEMGISYAFNAFEKMDLTAFYDKIEDRIVFVRPPFPPVFNNLGGYTVKGLEATLTLAPSRDMTVFAGANYMIADEDDIPYVPRWTFSSGVNYRFLSRYQLSVDAMYVDDQYVTSRGRLYGSVNTDKVDSYFLLNAKLTADVTLPWSNLSCEAYVAGENLTDTDYEQKKGYPMAGINGMAGFVLNF